MARKKEMTQDPYEVFLDNVIPQPHFMMKKGGVGTSPEGDIIAIKAQSKNGKSFLASIFASVILGNTFGELTPNGDENTVVLYFDTEQNKFNTQILMSRIHTLCGWEQENSDRLHVYAMRQMPFPERMEYIEAKTKEYKPSAIFIDGIADLLEDFNDIGQSQQLIQKLMNISADYHTAVFFILHTNKKDMNMKGHLGSLATQKCSDVFYIEKKNKLFVVTETDCRNVHISDFAFTIAPDGIPDYAYPNAHT